MTDHDTLNFLCRSYQPALRSIAPSPMITRTPSRKPVSRSHTKQVPLFQGNFVLDCPVPQRLMEASARKDEEFRTMRYSAVTCDPNDFQQQQYTLLPQLMQRKTELFIVMTMYNVSVYLCLYTMNFFFKKMIGRSCLILSNDAWCHEKHCPFMFQTTIQSLEHGRLEKSSCMYCS